jgi:hypothetical protein
MVQGPLPLRSGNLETGLVLENGINGLILNREAHTPGVILAMEVNPQPNEFLISLTSNDGIDGRRADSVLHFMRNEPYDTELDTATTAQVQRFLREHLDRIGDPKASGTNVSVDLPSPLKFKTSFVGDDGSTYEAIYEGGDYMTFLRQDGESMNRFIGQERIESLWLEDKAFKTFPASIARLYEESRDLMHRLAWRFVRRTPPK